MSDLFESANGDLNEGYEGSAEGEEGFGGQDSLNANGLTPDQEKKLKTINATTIAQIETRPWFVKALKAALDKITNDPKLTPAKKKAYTSSPTVIANIKKRFLANWKANAKKKLGLTAAIAKNQAAQRKANQAKVLAPKTAAQQAQINAMLKPKVGLASNDPRALYLAAQKQAEKALVDAANNAIKAANNAKLEVETAQRNAENKQKEAERMAVAAENAANLAVEKYEKFAEIADGAVEAVGQYKEISANTSSLINLGADGEEGADGDMFADGEMSAEGISGAVEASLDAEGDYEGADGEESATGIPIIDNVYNQSKAVVKTAGSNWKVAAGAIIPAVAALYLTKALTKQAIKFDVKNVALFLGVGIIGGIITAKMVDVKLTGIAKSNVVLPVTPKVVVSAPKVDEATNWEDAPKKDSWR